MRLLLYLIIFFIVILIFVLLKSMKKSVIITGLCSLLIIQIVLAPKLCIDSALLGLNLFINKVFPSLFPFLVVTGFMMMYGGVQVYSNLFGKIICKPLRLPVQCTFALIVSILCGYPLGAKYSCDLYEQGLIDRDTCQRLLNIATNTSPLFAIGAVGTSMLNSTYIGYLLLISNYISCLIMGLLLSKKGTYYKPNYKKNYDTSVHNIGSVVKESIETSIKTSLSVGGFVIIFCVITNIIKSNIIFDIAVKNIHSITGINGDLINGILLGLIEMTNGCNLLSAYSSNSPVTISVIGFFLGFSGLSIISQVYSFTYKYDLSIKTYIVRKIYQGFICAATTYTLYSIAPVNIYFQTSTNQAQLNSSMIFLATMFILFIPFYIYSFKRLFHAS